MKKKLFESLDLLTSKDIFFGPQGFTVISNNKDLEIAQHGHSKDLEGDELSGKELSNWQPSWLVFARDTEMGDPYFVDSSDESFPVYTAFYVDNGWQHELVSTSLNGFVACLNLLFEKSKQTSAQFIPDETTLIDQLELQVITEQLKSVSGSDPFWQLFLDCYIDWLTEDDDS